MKLKLSIAVLALVTAAALVGVSVMGTDATVARSRDQGYSPNYPVDKFRHDAGKLEIVVGNDMHIFDTEDGTAEWPIGSGILYLWNMYLWFGNSETIINNEYAQPTEWHPTSPVYDSEAGTTTPLPPSFGSHEGVDYGWMADFWRDDTPSRISDQDAHWYNTDADSSTTFGLEVCSHSMVWGAPGHDEWLTIIYYYRYVGGDTLDPKSYLAYAYDIDVGGSNGNLDDLVSIDDPQDALDEYNNVTWAPGSDGIIDAYDSVNFPMPIDGDESTQPYWDQFDDDAECRYLAYMYNGDEVPGVTGFSGARILRACINPGLDDEREYIVTSSHSWDWNNDPATDAYKYAYMSDVGTYEETSNMFDWRVSPSIGPLQDAEGAGMQPGDVLEVRMSFIVGEGFAGIHKNADQAMADALGFNGKFDDPQQGDEIDDFIVLSPPNSPLLTAVTGDGSVTLRFDPQVNSTTNIEREQDGSTGGQIDFEGYRIYRASTEDQLGDGSDLTPWFASNPADGDWPDEMPEYQAYTYGGEEPRYIRNLLAQWDKDINDTSHNWADDPEFDGPASLRAPGYEGNDNDQWMPSYSLDNWGDIFAESGDGEGYAPGTGNRIYEYVDDGTNYHDYDKWPYDDVTVDAPDQPRNHFTYYYSVVAFDYGASPIYNENIGSEPLPGIEGGVRANLVEVTLSSEVQSSLDNVLVVPNPYIGGVDWQTRSVTGVVERKLAFTNLPERCTIRIYTIAGDLVDILEHNDATSGTAWWSLQSRNSMEVASGVYVYHIDAPGIGTTIGKFAVLMGERI